MSQTPGLRSFRQLVAYAQQRAARSAERNDPIAWSYWITTMRWADNLALRGASPLEVLAETRDLVNWDQAHEYPHEVAVAYSRLKWCTSILRSLGFSAARLSLDWMRTAHEKAMLNLLEPTP